MTGKSIAGTINFQLSSFDALRDITKVNASCCLNTIPRLVIRGERGVNEEWLKHYGSERILSSGYWSERFVRLVRCFGKYFNGL